MITTTAQPVKAESMDSSLTAISNDTQKLKDYYTGTSFDYKNLEKVISQHLFLIHSK